jgi:hypothetical protein
LYPIARPKSMETPREIAKYLRPGARIVSIGLGADDAAATIGVAPDASYGTASEFAASPEDAVDLLVVARSVLAAGLLADAAGRRGEAGVVTVPCEVDLSRRLLDSPGVPEIVTALSEAGYSISSPARWLDRADRSPLLIVARADGRTIRPWAPGDEREILDLFEACFHSRRSVEWWRWEYAENPHGPLAASLAFDGDGLAAQYAGYPVPLWSANPELHGLTAHQIGDTMTATRVRSVGRGPTSVLVRTAKHFFASRCAGKVAFNYGFNTANIRTISTSYNESV